MKYIVTFLLELENGCCEAKWITMYRLKWAKEKKRWKNKIKIKSHVNEEAENSRANLICLYKHTKIHGDGVCSVHISRALKLLIVNYIIAIYVFYLLISCVLFLYSVQIRIACTFLGYIHIYLAEQYWITTVSFNHLVGMNSQNKQTNSFHFRLLSFHWNYEQMRHERHYQCQKL